MLSIAWFFCKCELYFLHFCYYLSKIRFVDDVYETFPIVTLKCLLKMVNILRQRASVRKIWIFEWESAFTCRLWTFEDQFLADYEKSKFLLIFLKTWFTVRHTCLLSFEDECRIWDRLFCKTDQPILCIKYLRKMVKTSFWLLKISTWFSFKETNFLITNPTK